MKRILLILFVLQSVALSAQHTSKELDEMLTKQDSVFQLNVGKQYPMFSTKSLENEAITNQSLEGKVTLINFWFTGCAPCIAEFDALNSLYNKYKSNPNIQLISITRDDTEQALATAQKYQLTYPVCPVEMKECSRLNFKAGFPTNIIVDQLGNIIYLKAGGSIDKNQIEKTFIELEQKILEALAL